MSRTEGSCLGASTDPKTLTARDGERLRALVAAPRLARLLAVLDGAGEETRVVGGAVRDALLGRPVHEVDLATTALPGITTARAGAAGLRTVPTGLAHGTVTVLVESESFEVTTLREDVETDGRHAVVRFGRDFAADARRRDLTLNALFADRRGHLHDAVGGRGDLAAGRVRFIGDARTRIREDYLRLLRFFRFHGEYGRGAIDPDGFEAAVAERGGLAGLSRERVRAELLKLLLTRRAAETVDLLAGAGLLGLLTGGVAEAGRLARTATADAGRPDVVARLAALLVRIPEDAERLRERLRLSNAETTALAAYAGAVAGLVSERQPLDPPALRRAAVLHGVPALLTVASALAGESRPVLSDAARAQLDRYRDGAEAAPVFPLTGADLLRRGVPAGPGLGRQLAAERGLWLAAGCPPDWPGPG